MSMDIKEIAVNLGEEFADIFKNELFGVLEEAKKDAEQIAREAAKAIEKYTTDLAHGEITKDDYRRYIKHWELILLNEADKQKVRTKSMIQRLADQIQETIWEKLMPKLK